MSAGSAWYQQPGTDGGQPYVKTGFELVGASPYATVGAQCPPCPAVSCELSLPSLFSGMPPSSSRVWIRIQQHTTREDDEGTRSRPSAAHNTARRAKELDFTMLDNQVRMKPVVGGPPATQATDTRPPRDPSLGKQPAVHLFPTHPCGASTKVTRKSYALVAG